MKKIFIALFASALLSGCFHMIPGFSKTLKVESIEGCGRYAGALYQDNVGGGQWGAPKLHVFSTYSKRKGEYNEQKCSEMPTEDSFTGPEVTAEHLEFIRNKCVEKGAAEELVVVNNPKYPEWEYTKNDLGQVTGRRLGVNCWTKGTFEGYKMAE